MLGGLYWGGRRTRYIFWPGFLKIGISGFLKLKPAFALGDADWEFWTESGGIRHFQVSTSIHLIYIFVWVFIADDFAVFQVAFDRGNYFVFIIQLLLCTWVDKICMR